jgi:predicted phosphodiesterase
MRILHISDLHLQKGIGNKVCDILKRFYDIIEANALRFPIDIAILSGDIRDKDNKIDIPEAREIISKIVVAAKLPNIANLHIVPGNHDLKRSSEIEEFIDEKVKREYNYENGIFNNEMGVLPTLNKRFDDFFWPLTDSIYNGANPWQNRDKEPHYSVNIEDKCFIFLNTSICCTSNNKDGTLLVGLVYLNPILKRANESNIKNIFFVAHHPLQNLANREETELQNLLMKYPHMDFNWLCGDAHNNRNSSRDYIKTYQVGSLTKYKEVIPDFAIYDIQNGTLTQKIFRFLPHLNSSSSIPGGWKRVYVY